MKAMIFEQTGEPADILHIRDTPDPAPGPGEILVRVLLSPVHPADLHVIAGALRSNARFANQSRRRMCGRRRGIGCRRGWPQAGNAGRLAGCLGELARVGGCSGRARRSRSRRGQRPGRGTGHDQSRYRAGLDHGRASPSPGRVARPDRRRIHCRPPGTAACAKRGISHAQHGAAVRAGCRDRGTGRRPDLVPRKMRTGRLSLRAPPRAAGSKRR